ncbi:4-hydroxythreonine-4-phosphate dehydrogenase PdxA [Minwuia sp.]|uniref:4-hydroxythreonine-4-phosphate dehydrogenase PdxA n=1 Tax=Minwuia sp. TaxID=2493630 RepID=UPI003A8F891D
MRPLIVTMGEPAGIGGEITLAAWLDRRRGALPAFAVLDDPARLGRLAGSLGLDVPIADIGDPAEAMDIFDTALPVIPLGGRVRTAPGAPDPTDAPLVIEAIERAVHFCQSGHGAGLVTNPISKADLYKAGFQHPGHTEFLGALCGTDRQVMMLAGPRLRVVPATVHRALKDVPDLLDTDDLCATGRTVWQALRTDFGIDAPRIAFSGLNPHAGENGTIGREEVEIIRPAVARLRAEGLDVSGPAPADSMFHDAARATYDAAICMYHDQALIPVKALDFDRTVNVTLGLPIVRTSPDHGTAYDIAGRGIARPDSLIEAIRLAGIIAKNRTR